MVNDEFKILSIDGGGIRCIIPAKLLSDLEIELSQEAASKTFKNCCKF